MQVTTTPPKDDLEEQGSFKPQMAITAEGLAPWSVSKLKLLEKCPLQFYLKYVRKLPVQTVPDTEDRMRMYIGSALHRILELAIVNKDVDKSYKRARIEFKKSIPKPVWDEKVELNRDNIGIFLDRVAAFSDRHPIKEIYTEQRLAITKDLQPARFFDNDRAFFRGVIDLVFLLENNDIFIIDHKTGGTSDFGMRNYEFQLDTYKPLFHFGVSPIRRAQAGIHFINEGSIMTGNPTPLEDIEHDIVRNLNFNIECAVDKVLEKGYFYYERNNFCKYCDYAELCKAGKRGTAGDLQQYEDESGEWIERFKNGEVA